MVCGHENRGPYRATADGGRKNGADLRFRAGRRPCPADRGPRLPGRHGAVRPGELGGRRARSPAPPRVRPGPPSRSCRCWSPAAPPGATSPCAPRGRACAPAGCSRPPGPRSCSPPSSPSWPTASLLLAVAGPAGLHPWPTLTAVLAECGLCGAKYACFGVLAAAPAALAYRIGARRGIKAARQEQDATKRSRQPVVAGLAGRRRAARRRGGRPRLPVARGQRPVADPAGLRAWPAACSRTG